MQNHLQARLADVRLEVG
jgi:hypothetical protein